MNLDRLLSNLVKHEGLELKPYVCPSGRLTIGIGRNIQDLGLSKDEAYYLAKNDINRCVAELIDIFGSELFEKLSDVRQEVLIDMIFNLGKPNFLKFKKLILAVKDLDFKEASFQMENSKWCFQVKARCDSLSLAMLRDSF